MALGTGPAQLVVRMGVLPITDEPTRHDSAPCEAPVMVDAGRFWCTGHSAEVSAEDLTLDNVQLPLDVGTGVDVYFELGALAAIEGRAVVTRADAGRVTLHFLDLDPEAVHALETYVSGGLRSSTQIRARTLPIV